MKSKLLIGFLIGIFLISFCSALTYQINTDVSLIISCDSINCSDTNNISITKPDSSLLIDNEELTISNGYAYIDLSLGSKVGDYHYYIYDSQEGYYSNSFKVNSIGLEQPQMVELFFIIFSVVIILLLIITLITTIAHFAQLDIDILDVTKIVATYFILIFFHYFASIYYPDVFILDLSGLLIGICGFTHLFVGILGFILSITIGQFKKGT
jgi:hypothetical protein